MKRIDNKIEQNKVQYKLDRKGAKISAWTTQNISNYKFLTGEKVLSEKDFLEKSATIKKM